MNQNTNIDYVDIRILPEHQEKVNLARADEFEPHCLDLIEKWGLCFNAQLIAHLPFSERSFYGWGFQYLQTIKRAIEVKRVLRKQIMLDNWQKKEGHPTLQIAAYRLMASDDELDRLNLNRQERMDADAETAPFQSFDLSDITDKTEDTEAEEVLDDDPKLLE
jgi:hypothetical protein